MKNISTLEKSTEELRRWLERVKVLKVVFMAIIGLRFVPIVAGDSPSLLTILPVLVYLVIEEIRILLDSKIRILNKQIAVLEKELSKDLIKTNVRDNRTLRFRRKSIFERDH